ncbi:MAG: efflux RND transporter periplasmic adaptor subunit [Bacteroidota bacterium]
MNRLSLLLLALALPASVLVGCQPPGDEPEADATAETDTAIPVEVVLADPDFFEDAIELTGTVDAPNDALLSPDVPGTLTYVAPIGAFVGRGGTVAQVKASTQRAGVAQAQAGTATARAGIAQAEAGIAQAEAGVQAAQAQRRAAQAQLELAEEQYTRQLPLLRDSILSAIEFRGVETQRANAQAGVAQADAGIAQAQGQLRAARENLNAARAQATAAQAGVASAQAQLANTRIVAPFGGTVEARLMEPGELASPGAPVVRLVSSGGVKVVAGVPERYAGDIEPGTQVRIVPTANNAEPRGGRVTFVGTAVNAQSRTFAVEIAVDNSDRQLKPDMVVRLNIAREVLQDAIVVPQQAVIRDERGTSVFIAVTGENGQTTAERRVVELGPDAGDEIVLLGGVEPGDRIIVSGQTSLAEGDLLRVTERERSASADPRAE